MKFDPVVFDEGRQPDGAFSATFARAFNRCARAAFLYQNLKGGASEPQLERGSALHAGIERSTLAAIENEQESIPAELAKAIADEVLADPTYHVHIEEHDYIRESIYRWAAFATFDPHMIVAVERMFFLDVGGWRIRMKIDHAELIEMGAAIEVKDYKSSRHLPSYEDIGRRLPKQGGRIAAKDLQLVLYALGVTRGVPVRVETNALGERVEIAEPFPIADRVRRVDLSYVFPGIEDKMTGGPATRDLSLTRVELEEYWASVEGLVARIGHAIETGEWPAIQGEGHCGECPAPKLCPIPEHLRKWAPNVDTSEEAAAEAQAIEVEAGLLTARRARLRAWVKRQPGQRLRFGADMVIEPVPQTATEIKDKDGFVAAAKDAAAYGRPFEEHKFINTRTSTPIRPRRLTEAELAEEEDAA